MTTFVTEDREECFKILKEELEKPENEVWYFSFKDGETKIELKYEWKF